MMKLDPNAPDPEPGELARELAQELVRAFAAISERLRTDPPPPGTPPADVAAGLQSWLAERLALFAVVFREDLDEALLVLGEGIDNLGLGEVLDPSRVAAFAAR